MFALPKGFPYALHPTNEVDCKVSFKYNLYDIISIIDNIYPFYIYIYTSIYNSFSKIFSGSNGPFTLIAHPDSFVHYMGTQNHLQLTFQGASPEVHFYYLFCSFTLLEFVIKFFLSKKKKKKKGCSKNQSFGQSNTNPYCPRNPLINPQATKIQYSPSLYIFFRLYPFYPFFFCEIFPPFYLR